MGVYRHLHQLMPSNPGSDNVVQFFVKGLQNIQIVLLPSNAGWSDRFDKDTVDRMYMYICTRERAKATAANQAAARSKSRPPRRRWMDTSGQLDSWTAGQGCSAAASRDAIRLE